MPPDPPGKLAEPKAPRRIELAAASVAAIAGHVLTAGLTLVLSSRMSPDDFQVFALCSSLFLVAKSFALMGMDRLALQVLPGMALPGDSGRARAFWRFAARRAAIGTVLGMIFVAMIGLVSKDAGASVMLTALGLPMTTLVQLLAVRSVIQSQTVRAVVAVRLLPALVSSVSAAALLGFGVPVTVNAMLVAWGLGWTIAAAVLWGRWPALHGRLPRASSDWSSQSGGFVAQSLLLSLMRRLPVIMAAQFAVNPAEVSTLVACLALADLAGALTPTIDRPFLRMLAQTRDRSTAGSVATVFRQRSRAFSLLVMAPMTLLAAVSPWLSAHFPNGTPHASITLVMVTCGSAALAFSNFPRKSLIQARDQLWKLIVLSICALLELALLPVMLDRRGALGASIAFALPAIVAAGFLVLRARRQFQMP